MEVIAMHWTMVMQKLGVRRSGRVLISFGLGGLVLHLLRRFYKHYQTSRRLYDKKDQIKQHIDAIRCELNAISDTDELLNLTELELHELQERVAAGTLDPIKLLHAYQLKALKVFDTGNSGICEFLTEAEEKFTEVSTQLAAGDSEKRLPMYGIPISIKESMLIKGYDSTCGLIKHCNQPNIADSVLVHVLRLAGAIPFVLTSTSQACRTIDGVNYIFGDALNPHNRDRISGGSSCGEGTLLGQRGSPIGIGSDIGGSIRIPAAYCGLASLKPTYNRLSARGMASLGEHSVIFLNACPGPMGQRVDDLADMMRTLLTPAMFDLDPQVPPLPFDEIAFNGETKTTLTIGIYDSISDPSIVSTVPVIREALRGTADGLARAGHRVVRFNVPDPTRAASIFFRSIMVDGGRELRQLLDGEPLGPHMQVLYAATLLPNWLKYATDFSSQFMGLHPIAWTRTLGGLRSAHEVTKLRADIRAYQAEFEQAWHDAGPIDALVCPASAFPAPPSATPALFITPSVFYTALYNVLDYPAGTVPVGCVDRVDVMQATKMAVEKRLDGDWYTSRVAMMQKDSEGLPVAVQVVGRPFREETVLRVMRIIETANKRVTSDRIAV